MGCDVPFPSIDQRRLLPFAVPNGVVPSKRVVFEFDLCGLNDTVSDLGEKQDIYHAPIRIFLRWMIVDVHDMIVC